MNDLGERGSKFLGAKPMLWKNSAPCVGAPGVGCSGAGQRVKGIG
jgi:hypothetical protein